MKLEGKQVLVLGLGISGRSAAHYCVAKGASVVAADERPALALGDLRSLEDAGHRMKVVTGCAFPDPADFDLVIPSPGIPSARYRARARRVWGDIELVRRALEVPIIAVTGTNGKSTTVLLIEAMLRAAGLRARAAGNLGTPALDLVGEALDVAVLEVSSFQLETTETFRPEVAVVLNISPDHLDRHGDIEGYARAKRLIVERQRAGDTAVLCFDDPIVARFADAAGGDVLPFRTRGPAPEGFERAVWLDTGAAVLRGPDGTRRLSLDSLQLTGRHNLENVLASVAALFALDADVAKGMEALADFGGLPHRGERVAVVAGALYINDSKATNPGAAIRALESAGGKLIWIAGGRDKDLGYEELADAAAATVKVALLIGEAAEKLQHAIGDRIPCETLVDLPSAVRRAAALADPGDVVLLAPACASFDQFASFEARGDCFREAVLALEPSRDVDSATNRSLG